MQKRLADRAAAGRASRRSSSTCSTATAEPVATPDAAAAVDVVRRRAHVPAGLLRPGAARIRGAVRAARARPGASRTGYGAQTIPEIVSASTRPQMALMIVLALIMAGGVFFVASAAAREVRVAELKSNFVASVSHDLKTPLALIQLFAETLELGRVRNAERAQEYYRIINTEARKLTRLIENILDFSRMEAGPAAVSDWRRSTSAS